MVIGSDVVYDYRSMRPLIKRCAFQSPLNDHLLKHPVIRASSLHLLATDKTEILLAIKRHDNESAEIFSQTLEEFSFYARKVRHLDHQGLFALIAKSRYD